MDTQDKPPLSKIARKKNRRTGRNAKKTGKDKDGSNNDGYYPESELDSTVGTPGSPVKPGLKRNIMDKENMQNYSTSQSVPSQLCLSGVDQATYNEEVSHRLKEKFAWIRNRNIGRRTGRDVRAGKTIRKDSQGFERFSDYLSESEAESFISFSQPAQTVSKLQAKVTLLPQESEKTSSSADSAEEQHEQSEESEMQTQISNDTNMETGSLSNCQKDEVSQRFNEKFAWIRNPNIGRRTGRNVKAGKIIRKDSYGFERFSDYLSESEAESFISFSQPTKTVSKLQAKVKHLSQESDKPSSSADSVEENLEEEQTESEKEPEVSTDVHTDSGSQSNCERTDKEASPPQEEIRLTGKRVPIKIVSVANTTESAEQERQGVKNEPLRDEQGEVTQGADNLTVEKSETDKEVVEEDQETSLAEAVNQSVEAAESAETEVSSTEEETETAGDVSVSNNHESVEVTDVNADGTSEVNTNLERNQHWCESGIEAGGNKSGSITKKEQKQTESPVKVFLKTKKKLSYSAAELSANSKRKQQQRLKAANVELANQSTEEPVEETVSQQSNHSGQINHLESEASEQPSQEPEQTTAQTTRQEVPYTRSEDSLESGTFLSLINRHEKTSSSQHVDVNDSDSDNDDDDDIVMLDAVDVKNKTNVKSTVKNDSKKTTKSTVKSRKNSKSVSKGNKSGVQTEKVKKTRKKSSQKKTSVVKEVERNEESIQSDLQTLDTPLASKTRTGRKRTSARRQLSVVEGNVSNVTNVDIEYSPLERLELSTTALDTNTNCETGEKKKRSKSSQGKLQNSYKEDLVDVVDLSTNNSNVDSEIEHVNTHEELPAIDTSVIKSNRRKSSLKKQQSANKQNLSLASTLKSRQSSGSSRSQSSGSDSDKKTKKVSSPKAKLAGKLTTKKSKSEKSKRSSAKTRTSKINKTTTEVLVDPQTPEVNSSFQGAAVFASGVSFRVSRRSEMPEVEVETESPSIATVPTTMMSPSVGLTPCIAKPKSRKSKGRRVTICPEINIEHYQEVDHEATRVSPRVSLAPETPLPSFNSTPLHIWETTHNNISTDDHDTLEMDRLIYPEPAPEGLRRSQRTRVRPVAWYKGERVVIEESDQSGPVIVGVKPSNEVKYLSMEAEKRKRRLLRNAIRKATNGGKKNSKWNRKLSIHGQLPTNCLSAHENDVTIINADTQEETHVSCFASAQAYNAVGPGLETPKITDPYSITVLLDLPIYKAGTLTLKARAMKPSQVVTETGVVYHVMYGQVLATIHNTSMLMETGSAFTVPFGNTYSLENMRTDEAVLAFTVLNKMEGEDANQTM